jgi:manganese/zinc/iron transport system substrate-binding protein
MKNTLSMIALALGLMSCQSAQDENLLVATTGQLGDALTVMTQRTPIQVKTLMGPGVNPHSYQAKISDIDAISQAHMIFYNGLDLEAKLEDLLEDQGDRSLSVGGALPTARLIPWDGEEKLFDPHVWNDMDLWWVALKLVEGELIDLYPQYSAVIQENMVAYALEFNETRNWALEAMAEIPEPQRILITSHDAFQYFSDYFGLESRGLQGISTEDEASIEDRRALAQYIVDNQVPAIFTESSVSPRAVEALMDSAAALGWEVLVPEEELLSDALGEEAPSDTYLGMIRHNVGLLNQYLIQGQ